MLFKIPPAIRDENRLIQVLGYPSAVLIFGILLFQLQIMFAWWTPGGFSGMLLQSICVATLLAGFTVAAMTFIEFSRRTLTELTEAGWSRQLRFFAFTAFALLLAAAVFSSLKPAHVDQEGDFLRYHLLLPKQHWLAGNWKPVEWNDSEFFTLTVQDAFSFLWVGLPLLNKLPHLMIFGFLLLKMWYSFSLLAVKRPFYAGFCAVLCFLAFRGVATQIGTAMMDLPNIYFLLSIPLGMLYLRKAQTLSKSQLSAVSFFLGIDMAAYLGYKSFAFILLGTIAFTMELLLRVLFRESFLATAKRLRWPLVVLPAFLLWLPDLIRSFYYTGDPFYPVFPQLTKMFCDSSHLQIRKCADNIAVAMDLRHMAFHGYGYGRGILGFVKAFTLAGLHWPFERRGFFFGQNSFDYPLGVFWYLSWGFLVLTAVKWPAFRKFAIYTGAFSAAFFCVWFAGAQETRWLYPVILALSLYWGYVFSERLGNRPENGSRALLALLVFTLLTVTVNSAKVLLVQRKTLSCMGAECLKFKPPAYEDYAMTCPAGPVLITNAGWRGYIPCVTTGPTPHITYPQ